MPMHFEPLDFSRIRTYSIAARKNKVSCQGFARPYREGSTFADFIATIPSILAGGEYREIIDSIVKAHLSRRLVLLTMGAHVIKVGLSPIVIDLVKRGIINAIAFNGAGSVHDLEIALVGETSENVADGIREGTFGMVRETGDILNECALRAYEEKRGFGEVIGERISEAPFASMSIFAEARKAGVPTTVHVALGSDIFHTHPAARGDAIGAASFHDFRLLCGIISQATEGSVIMNAGSAVVLPTVIEKAIAAARNLGCRVEGFTGINIDFLRQYRSLNNPVNRAKELGGKGYSLTGHHEFMIPLIAAGVIEELRRTAGN
ncbi:MAG: hypothetical protein RDV48_15245 [Candidatus Eremiobacteraeota bacterium]|nr:hypothetical protein [Candidatus Eremiobacteraeota bacterium]